ncbi:hypothetical protein PHYPO_G00178590 [Pangasianodon hypophthalmus]|uniref:Uncharacterized protein n=1 Tax=Pangasianodon hypophthalmus TaxID=310915 RepID=A0A5N5PPW7_PANHP|nr:hypothetical protein PHYPO_G00178590 [Pangasianodon hypophthalmus]
MLHSYLSTEARVFTGPKVEPSQGGSLISLLSLKQQVDLYLHYDKERFSRRFRKPSPSFTPFSALTHPLIAFVNSRSQIGFLRDILCLLARQVKLFGPAQDTARPSFTRVKVQREGVKD